MTIIDRIGNAENCGQVTNTGYIINHFGERVRPLTEATIKRNKRNSEKMKAALKAGIDW